MKPEVSVRSQHIVYVCFDLQRVSKRLKHIEGIFQSDSLVILIYTFPDAFGQNIRVFLHLVDVFLKLVPEFFIVEVDNFTKIEELMIIYIKIQIRFGGAGSQAIRVGYRVQILKVQILKKII